MRKAETADAPGAEDPEAVAHVGPAGVLESLEAFGEIAQNLRGVSEVPAICDRVVQVLKARLGLKTCSVMLLDADGETLVNVAGTSPRPEGQEAPTVHRRFRVGEGVAGRVARTGEAILVPDATRDPRFEGGDARGAVRSLLCLPIPGPDGPMGVLNLSHGRRDFFGEDHRTVFSILATILGKVLAEAVLTERLAAFNRDLEAQVADRTREIQASHAYLEQILGQASDIILTVDWRGRVTYVNPRIAQLGYRADELMGKPFSTLCERGRLPTPLTDAMAGRVCRNVALVLVGPGDERLDTYCSFSPMADPEGGGQGALVLVRDVTDTRRMELQLRQMEKLTAVGTLVAGIAHEINNKLVPILIYSELLQRADLGEREAKLVQTVHKSAVGARHIMDSLLRFSRQDAPHMELRDLNEVVREVTAMVQYRARKQDVTLDCRLEKELPRLRMDANQVAQVVLNLVNNACDAVGDGGTVTLGTAREQGRLRLWVEDDGPGMDEATVQRIFDPFFTTKDVGKGTGLGLSLCYGIVREHGGEITVQSRPGRTRFDVTLPLATEAAAEPGPAPDPAPKRAMPRGRVLVADDDPALLEVLDHVLAGRHEVVREQGGRAAVERLAGDRFDAVLLDLHMADMDGAQVYAWIEQHKPDMARRVIVMTASAMDFERRLGHQVPPKRLLTKPFHLAEVQAALETVLAGEEG
jgi:PAS domain S-box-containing protein